MAGKGWDQVDDLDERAVAALVGVKRAEGEALTRFLAERDTIPRTEVRLREWRVLRAR